MQTCCLGAQSWTVRGPGGTPAPQRGLSSLAVSQPVCDGEAGVSLQLRQNHQHLPERGHTHIMVRLSVPKAAHLSQTSISGSAVLLLDHRRGGEPVQRGDAVHGLQAAARRHHVEAVAAVAGHVEVMPGVSVLHHDDEPRPAVGQVVTGHPLSPLRSSSRHRTPEGGREREQSGGTSCLSPLASLSWMMASAMVVLQPLTCSTTTALRL